MRQFAGRIVLGFWLSIGVWGCASGEAVSPLERAVDVGQKKVESGWTKGQQEADDVQGVFLKVRYNPARCDVPSFEIFTHARWMRVYFDGSQEITTAFRDIEDGSAVLSMRSYREVSGKFSGRRRTDAGVRYPVFVVSDLREPSVSDSGARAGAEPFERIDDPRACL